MAQAALQDGAFSDIQYSVFRRKVKGLIGIDLEDYRSGQLMRRLQAIMARAGAADLIAYGRMLEQDAQQLKEFSDYLTINVSEFFRDPDRFAYLKDKVLPELIAGRRRLNVWSAGCANGAEPYTLAILLEELSPGCAHRVLATDIDDRSLLKARLGADYREQDVRNLPISLLKKYFIRQGSRYEVVHSIRRRPIFKKHNLLSDPFEEGFDLILCRNVVIYFTVEAKDRVFQGFSSSLKPGGVLFVGATEVIQNCGRISLEAVRPSFYRRIG
ncbi:MAG: CheR family methyltransferase [Chloroflexota bacterium]